jgi:16S rRNA A1518/A1519 N6-dimethyltransferase RsmA/KsgA/DIM1 with predicted DNA glycosylase/AP lyase activity
MDRIENKVLSLIQDNISDKTIRILELTPGQGRLTRLLLDNGYTNIEALDIVVV